VDACGLLDEPEPEVDQFAEVIQIRRSFLAPHAGELNDDLIADDTVMAVSLRRVCAVAVPPLIDVRNRC
jgi:hypothetical protein